MVCTSATVQTLKMKRRDKAVRIGEILDRLYPEPAFAVDTHIHRLAWRWGLSSGKNVEQTERDLKKLFPRNEWAKRHLQMIYFGREYCPARNHDFAACPICSWAAAKRVRG